MKRFALYLALILLCGSILFALDEPGELAPTLLDTTLPDSLNADLNTKTRLDSLFYAADSIRAYYESEEIYLYSNTSIDYQDSNIQADSLYVNLKKEQARTWGTTLLRDGDQLLIGKDVLYDVGSQTGILYDGLSYIENGFYQGTEIRKTGARTYDIDGGSFTTCDLEEPSYWFWAQKMRIYQRDKVVGKHVVAYVNHLPVFYFPFITMSIKRGRERGFLIPSPGYNSADGKYVKDIAYYIPYKDLADFTLGLDLMEKTGWKSHFDTNYIKRYSHAGAFNASYQKNIYRGGKNFDWSLKGSHHQDLPEKSALDLNVDFISNKRIYQGSGDINESLAQWLNSSFSYRKPLGSTYLNAAATYNQDLINDTASLSLPSLSWSLPSRPVYELFSGNSNAWYSGISYSFNTRLDHTGNLRHKHPTFQDYIWQNTLNPADSTQFLVEHHLGMKHNLGLSNSYNYRGWLNLRQSVSYGEAWYDRDKEDNKWVRGNDYSASLNGSFNLYGIRNFQRGPVSSLRHVLSPNLGISYVPDFEDNKDYYSFGGISLRQGKKQANLSLGMDQKWQLKLDKAHNDRKLNELFSLSSRISANLLEERKRFSNLSHQLNFRPGAFDLGSIQHNDFNLEGLKLDYNSSLGLNQKTYGINWQDLAIESQYFSQSLALSGAAGYRDYFPAPKNRSFSGFGDAYARQEDSRREIKNSWNIGLTHDLYAPKKLLNPATQNLRLSANLYINRNYSLSYSNYYNLKKRELISNSLHLSRDLHCWKLDISINQRNEYWDYRIVFFNTQFPDALKFQTHDSKRY